MVLGAECDLGGVAVEWLLLIEGGGLWFLRAVVS